MKDIKLMAVRRLFQIVQAREKGKLTPHTCPKLAQEETPLPANLK